MKLIKFVLLLIGVHTLVTKSAFYEGAKEAMEEEQPGSKNLLHGFWLCAKQGWDESATTDPKWTVTDIDFLADHGMDLSN